MKTSNNQHMVRSLVLVGVVKVLERELAKCSNSTIRNQLDLLDVVAKELRELAEAPTLREPDQHPLYVSGKDLARMVLNGNYLQAHRRAAARAFLELANVSPDASIVKLKGTGHP